MAVPAGLLQCASEEPNAPWRTDVTPELDVGLTYVATTDAAEANADDVLLLQTP
jgi:hypothetical protein